MVRTDLLYTKPEFLREVQAGEDDWTSFLEAGLPVVEIEGELFVGGADFDAWIHDGQPGLDLLNLVWTMPAAAVWGEPCGEYAA